MSKNRLAQETSPYLLQHRDNPVHWWPWSPQALSEAQEKDKPILLSVGYAACHWCHVMAHESFENAAIAAQMNGAFINIKVDREERPDIDAIYQAALSVLGEQGGWPLTMFLKPDGTPFWGGTYFPPESRYGRPGFPAVLDQISSIYRDKRDQVEKNAAALTRALRQAGTSGSAGALSLDKLAAVARGALQMIDFHNGGTMGAPKFPQPTFFRFLWHSYLRTGEQQLCEAVVITLSNICQGGIYDHLGGGFSRYSVDAYWLAPHFEKMLYDNALLVELLCDVWQETRFQLFATRIHETVNWMLRELKTETADGLFALASAYDADSEGEEGKYYVWSLEEVTEILGEDAGVFAAAYDVSQAGNWEGKSILRRRTDDLDADEKRAQLLAKARKKLLSVRGGRIPPGRDDKVLADWNGMAITALVRAGILFNQQGWIAAARTIYAFIKTHMMTGERLHHTWCAGRPQNPAVIDDYANMARAALALFQHTGDKGYLNDARGWADIAEAHYLDPENGGYFIAADDTADLIMRTKTLYDNAVPSGGGVMLEVLARLYHLTGDGDILSRAHDLVAAMTPADERAIMNQPSLALGFEILSGGQQIVIVTPDTAARETRELVRSAETNAGALATLLVIHAEEKLPPPHPAAGKGLAGGAPVAYVCRGQVCGAPVTAAADLADALRPFQ